MCPRAALLAVMAADWTSAEPVSERPTTRHRLTQLIQQLGQHLAALGWLDTARPSSTRASASAAAAIAG